MLINKHTVSYPLELLSGSPIRVATFVARYMPEFALADFQKAENVTPRLSCLQISNVKTERSISPACYIEASR